MRYAVAALFALSSLAFTQNPTSTLHAIPRNAVQVLYVADTANLYTYDIDPQTFQPSLMGTIPLPKAQLNQIAASSDGKLLYLMASDLYPATNNRIYAYDTTGYGVPGMPFQSVPATKEYSMVVDPTGKFLYAVRTGWTTKQERQYSWIIRYQLDSTTGELTNPVKEATYLLDVQGTKYCSLSIAGMSAKGTEIYDYVFCGTHEGANGTYDQRSVDPTTGALGFAQQLLTWSVGTIGNPNSVQFVKKLIFDFAYPIAYQPYNELQVYPLSPNDTRPLIDCTATMLTACGSDNGVAHPSAKYVFYTNSQTNTTEVDAVERSSKQIVATGTTFATPQPNRLEFSPDGSVVYSWDNATSMISIFGFNASTAAITTGGSISESNTVAILAAERH
jgi:hypothetical protein